MAVAAWTSRHTTRNYHMTFWCYLTLTFVAIFCDMLSSKLPYKFTSMFKFGMSCSTLLGGYLPLPVLHP